MFPLCYTLSLRPPRSLYHAENITSSKNVVLLVLCTYSSHIATQKESLIFRVEAGVLGEDQMPSYPVSGLYALILLPICINSDNRCHSEMTIDTQFEMDGHSLCPQAATSEFYSELA